MLTSAIILFALAALLGLYLLSYVLRSKETPKAITIIHGTVAAAGLVILIIFAFYNSPSPWVSVLLFTLAAMGGLLLFHKDLSGKPLPKWLAIGHGIIAVIAFVFLIVFTFM